MTAGRSCFASGEVPVDHDGNRLAADELTGHVQQAFANREGSLADEGLALPDFVSITTNSRGTVDPAAVAAACSRLLGGHRCTSTAVGADFLDPAWRLEAHAVPWPENSSRDDGEPRASRSPV
jgi:enamine deaminase RidA (YjgF/YER057c/UK114 family)